MNQEIRNYVMQKMSPFLDNGQTLRLERILEEVQLKQENGSDYEEDNAELLEKFIAAKRLEGRSDGTLNYYQFTIEKMFEDIGKNIRNIQDRICVNSVVTNGKRGYMADEISFSSGILSIIETSRNNALKK